MTDAPRQSKLPTAFELLESVLVLITGAVLAAPMLPGFVLTVPALILFAVVVLAPLIAAAALVTRSWRSPTCSSAPSAASARAGRPLHLRRSRPRRSARWP